MTIFEGTFFDFPSLVPLSFPSTTLSGAGVFDGTFFEMPSAIEFAPLSLAITPGIVQNDGGYKLSGIVTPPPADGDYNVHIGPLGSLNDPICYSGIQGQGSVIKFVSGVFICYSAPLPTGGPYGACIVPVGGSPIRVSAVLVISDHDFRTKQLALKGLMPRNWKFDFRESVQEDFPQT